MWREKSKVLVTVAAVLVLVWAAQAQDRSEGGAPPITEVRPLPPGGPAPVVSLLRRQADVLRGRAQEAQRMADELRRQAEELDQTAMRLMDQGPGPQPKEQVARELQEIKEAIGRAEREGRRQEAQELRRRAEQLMGQLQPMPTGPGMEERQEIKGQVERLLDEALVL